MDRRGAWEQVALHIRTMIFEGTLRAGDRVPQDEIAAELGVSRIPVREAIIALERDAWVRILPHRGAFVTGLDEATVGDLYEMLGLIYGLVVRRATERADDDARAAIAAQQKKVAAAESPEQMVAANEAFLGELRRLGGSPRISSTLRSMGGVVPGNFFAVIDGSIPAQKRGVKAVAAAVRDGNGDAAAEAMVQMMRAQGRSVLDVLKSRGVLA